MRRIAVLLSILAAVLAGQFGTVGALDATPSASAGIAGAYDVGGRELYNECVGSGSPTVVFDVGLGDPASSIALLQRELAADHLACTYERANTGRSGPAPSPRTGADVVADLHDLLAAADVPGPYVLVGQSAGGVFVQLYARTYPDEVAGVVSMNAVPPAGPWLEQALPFMTEQERPDEEGFYRGECCADELVDWVTSFAQLEAAPAPPDVPFEVLISTIAQCASPDDICGRTYAVYESVMQDVADEWPQGHFSQVEAGHQIWVDAFDETVAVIRRVLSTAEGSPATPVSGTPTA